MNNTPAKLAAQMTMDELVQKASAFASFKDLERSVNEHDYIPTLQCKGLAKVTRSQRVYQAAKNELAKRLIADGVKVYISSNSTYRGVTSNYKVWNQ